MNTDPASTAGSSSRDSRSGAIGSARARDLVLGFLILLLAALVFVPILIGRRIDELRDRQVDLVFPAQRALQESRSLLTEQLAAIRGYQISGEARYLTRFQDLLIRERPATDRLVSMAGRLGPEARAAIEEFEARIALWQESPRALLAGAMSRDELVGSLPIGQERFEAALAAADEAGAALNRSETQLGDRIRAVARLERLLTVLLSLGALAAGLLMVRVMNRLHRTTQQLEERAERLRQSEERFRLIADNLQEMIWISDPNYTVQYYLSPAYERIWDRSIDEARRNPRSFLQAVVPEDRARVEAALEGYARGEYAADYRILRPDGEVRWISGRAYPVRDEHGNIFRIAGIAEDVTAQKQVEQEREQLLDSERVAHAKTEAALRLRDRVVGIVSHDLKNPLHTIGMAAELLEMGLTDEQRAKQIGIIRRTVARANRMVGDLLDAARLQSGRAIAIAPAPVEVEALLAEALEAFRFQADHKNQQLTYEPPESTVAVRADHDRIVQALSNLLGNAVKFTPEGGRIRIGARVEDGIVSFFVSDTGPGIAAELLPRLFEPFTQAKDTASLGTGLGLAITRGIVEAHGGTIAVHSEPGTGTTFTFTLPSPRTYPDPVDDTLDDSFPASDPPPWWAG